MKSTRRIAKWWRRLGGTAAGRSVFARLLCLLIPYTGTVRPYVVELRPGYARVLMRDRRQLRNHLGSLHAVALTNIGEVASGLALVPWLKDARGIVVQISTRYLKKARGTLTAEGTSAVPEVVAPIEHETSAHIRDAAGDTVAVVTARWKLSPTPARGKAHGPRP